MGFDFFEFDHSPTEEYGPEGSFVAKRRLGCAWADRYDVLSLFEGGTSAIYPYNTNFFAYAVGATIVPLNDEPALASGTTNQWSYGTAVITITYAISPYYPHAINSRMMIEEMHPWIEYRTLPADKSHVGTAAGAAPEHNPRVIVPGMDYILTSFNHTTVSTNVINLMGLVNQAEWNTYMLGITFAAETLLYLGPQPTVTARLGYTTNIKVTQSWKWRSIPWSKELTENGWEWIYNDAGNKIYQTGDFNHLTPFFIL